MHEVTPSASTTAGRVTGASHRDVVRFLGVPYAGSTAGPRRLRPPVPPDPWNGERDCTRHGAICPQVILPEGLSVFPDLSGRGRPQSEDCLAVDVYTPAADGALRPTVVWLHGGAFVSGSAGCPLYDGSSFARDGVVFVGVNYRLHGLGYLYLDELFGLPGAGNCGLADQVAALIWVHDNIAAFGGDPDQVTVVGESAGAMSAATLLAVPAARGLFRRIVALSGAAHHNLLPESAERVARRVLERAAVPIGDHDALAAVPAATIAAVAQQVAFMDAEELLVGEHAGVRTVFAPVVDGGLVPRRAIDAVVAGSSDGVDAVIATCADEYRVFIWGLPEPLRSMVPPPDPTAYFRTTERDPATVVAAYQSNRPGAGQLDVAAAIAGDAVFGIPAVRLLEAKAGRGDRVWAHEMAWPTPVLDGSLGACHGLDLPFLFDDLGHPGFVGPEPPQAVADDLHGLCVRFASGGDPNGGRLPPWPVYDSASRSVMRLHETSGVVHDPRAAERIVWEGTW